MAPNTTRHTTGHTSGPRQAGYYLGMLMGFLSIFPTILIPSENSAGDEVGPPLSVKIVSAVLGLFIIGLLVLARQSGSRGPKWAAIVLIALGAITAVPAFGNPDVPVWVQASAGLGVAVAVSAVALLTWPAGRASQRVEATR